MRLHAIHNPHGENLDFRYAPAASPDPVAGWIVLLAHGVTGNLDRPVIADTAAALNQAGFATLRFSFSGNGESEGDFREATIRKEIADLGAVIDTVSQIVPHIAVVGHSMGAAVAVMRASSDPRISALVSLAGMVDTKRFAETEFGGVVPDQGFMWDDPECPLSEGHMREFLHEVASTLPAARQVMVPWLLVHGTADDLVFPDDTTRIVDLAKSNVQARFVEGADHSFSQPDHKLEMTGAVTRWLTGVARSQPSGLRENARDLGGQKFQS